MQPNSVVDSTDNDTFIGVSKFIHYPCMYVCDMSIRHEYSKGTATLLMPAWEFLIFLAVTDCKLLYTLIQFPITILSN